MIVEIKVSEFGPLFRDCICCFFGHLWPETLCIVDVLLQEPLGKDLLRFMVMGKSIVFKIYFIIFNARFHRRFIISFLVLLIKLLLIPILVPVISRHSFGNLAILLLVLLIKDNVDQIKTGQERIREINVSGRWDVILVFTIDGVGSGKD